ncbi:hypothetical protein BDY19DRAFT_98976 [Irpex rosettiformis]|uniref:Uncharacterized protein n=1 Tax=Irpex rosettiformis TaxID=378272 RepID=A0ACB8U6W1_9APHY|nr:hypothetical protein BDY19DRAFT_98976 [Irpex rosettiformis]
MVSMMRRRQVATSHEVVPHTADIVPGSVHWTWLLRTCLTDVLYDFCTQPTISTTSPFGNNVTTVLTTRVNITVDDSGLGGSLSQITYAPPGGWNVGNNCSACTAHPSPGEAFAGTWHDTTFPANGTANDLKTASLVFNGSAIYVFCVLAHSFTSPTSTSDMTFYLDGQVVGHFLSVPDGDTTYDYNVPVYSNALLTPGSHSFTLQGGRVGGSKSLVLLDYIVYSQDLETPTATQPFPTDSNVGISTIPHSTNSSTFGSSISSSNSTQLRDSQDMSPSHARTIAIATAVPICVIVLAISVVGVLLYRRKRNSERSPYPHNPPMEPNITEDPSSSGWVEGAFGRQEGSGVFEHPSLTPKGSVPEALRGDPNTRGVPKYGRERSHTESSSASARRPSIRPGRSGSAEPPSNSSVAIEMTKMSRSGRHPYAAPTPEPDIEPIVDESDPGQPSSSVAEDSSLAVRDPLLRHHHRGPRIRF